MTPGREDSRNRSRWTRPIRAYGQGLMGQPLLAVRTAANLRARRAASRALTCSAGCCGLAPS